MTQLKAEASQQNREGMARFGITIDNAFGISVATIRKIAKPYKKNHQLALELWQTGWHEARILASIIDDPNLVTPAQMGSWMRDFNSWDICDQVCSLFDKTPYAVAKIKEWTQLKPEFQKRAGFALMAELAWHSKTEPDQTFINLLPIIEREAWDGRNFVKKAANWALREIGRRNKNLNQEAMKIAEKIAKQDSKSAHWIAADAIRELRLKAKS